MKNKRNIAVVLAIVLALTMSGGTAFGATGDFSDIKGHWAENIIKEGAALGIVGGYPEGYFLPENLMKREEFFKLLTNVLTTKPDISKTVISFKDVDPIEWYVPTIKTIAEAGIANGYDDGTIGIGMMVSRQEAAKLVASIIPDGNMNSSTATVATAKDKAEIGEWAYAAVDKMFKKGYMQGDLEGKFRPTAALTRAEAATLLLHVKKSESLITGPKNRVAVPVEPVGTAGCQKEHPVTGGAFTLGTGTAKDPYLVTNEAQLDHVRTHGSEGSFFKQTKDITITKDFAAGTVAESSKEVDWTQGNFQPIGSKDKPFVGNYDGNEYSVSGITINGTVRSGSGREPADYCGLFGALGEKATVTDVNLRSADITGRQYVGGIAGDSKGEITNCIFDANSKVKGTGYVGGIMGSSDKPVESNVNKGTVNGTDKNVGGIAGAVYAAGDVVTDCVNKGSVTGREKTGGIVGCIYDTDGYVTVQGCENSGTVNGSNYYGGGIVGYADGANNRVTITACKNSGEIEGEGLNGGIIGYMKNSKVNVNKCSNSGYISGSNAGGIAGTNEGTVEICSNTGKIAGKLAAGGIVGANSAGGKAFTSYNDGAISSTNHAGGIAGENDGKIINCYNTAKVAANVAAGGVVGRNKGFVENVYNAGPVSSDNGEGSIAGRNGGDLENSFWLSGTCGGDTGFSDSGYSKSLVVKLTKEELSGQAKVKTSKGYQLITGIMNATSGSRTWEFIYRTTTNASESSSNVISDGGGVVPPIEVVSTSPDGNVINSSDLDRVYLYPSLVELKR